VFNNSNILFIWYLKLYRQRIFSGYNYIMSIRRKTRSRSMSIRRKTRSMSNRRNTRKNKSRSYKKGGGYYCEVCDFSANGEEYWNQHLRSERHKLKVAQSKKAKDLYCEHCDASFNTDYMYNLHKQTPGHKMRASKSNTSWW